jgi:hypothetical protein
MPSSFSDLTAGVTVLAVFNPHTSNNYQRIIDLGNGTPSDNVVFSQFGTQSTMNFDCFLGAIGDQVTGNSELTLNTSQEYTAIDDPNNNTSLYKDGILLNSVPGTDMNNVLRTLNYIGKSNWAGDAFLDGDISEILIYNRPLSNQEQQLAELYLANKYNLYNPGATWLSNPIYPNSSPNSAKRVDPSPSQRLPAKFTSRANTQSDTYPKSDLDSHAIAQPESP